MATAERAAETADRGATARALARLERALDICGAEPDATFENVWHALILLEADPRDRLNRSLIRGRAAIQRSEDGIIVSKRTTGRPKDLSILPALEDTLRGRRSTPGVHDNSG